MASIFTYEGHTRVASPWLTPVGSPKPSTPRSGIHAPTTSCTSPLLADYGVTRLEAEPQEGPTEYKLHLLLRPRRTYSSSSTGRTVSGSQQIQQPPRSSPSPNVTAPIPAPSNTSRQNRLEQLTTQLLWRLQQSSPYHASSTSELVLPKLPEAKASLESPSRTGKLLAGLEESRGALYEIGVSDDGTFVGLTNDEMEESLTNLRAMAASLGCNVEVVRKVIVGNCEWHEMPTVDRQSIHDKSSSKLHNVDTTSPLRHRAPLWVAEALVIPDLASKRKSSSIETRGSDTPRKASLSTGLPEQPIQEESLRGELTEQLRITLTGPTTSGKSSLLGTLSTATLDNGRGKSRLSLLKHRHEIKSGVTSSVTQELMGYKAEEVINFASGNVTSWTDIHASAEHGRLVFVSDSAGHPKFRRTTVRGLVGWQPHWTLLCVAADHGENVAPSAGGTSSAQDILGSAGAGIELVTAHLDLCLKLEKPLAIVITKLDLASKSSLRQTLSKILSAVKATGRTPTILPADQTKVILESEITSIPKHDIDCVRVVTDKLKAEGLTTIVPIVLTSAAKGTGIRLIHALLSNLPMPPIPTAHDLTGPTLNPEQPACLFHVEDTFGLPASYESLASVSDRKADSGSVVAGHLRFGRLSVGDRVVTGPFPADTEDNALTPDKIGSRNSPNSFGNSFPHSSSAELARVASRNSTTAAVTKGEWHMARIVSIRNLRLPVHTLEAGQVGTIGVVFDPPEDEMSNGTFERTTPATPRLRKGMVLATPSNHMIKSGHTLQAANGFTAAFEDGDINSVTAGSLVVVYIASIRASARVVRLVPHANKELSISDNSLETEDVFGFGDAYEDHEPELPIFGSHGITDVTLELLTTREWIELGSQVLVMPGGGHGLYSGSERGEKGVAGLDGFVGKVIEVID